MNNVWFSLNCQSGSDCHPDCCSQSGYIFTNLFRTAEYGAPGNQHIGACLHDLNYIPCTNSIVHFQPCRGTKSLPFLIFIVRHTHPMEIGLD
jgi:hypothetical protein